MDPVTVLKALLAGVSAAAAVTLVAWPRLTGPDPFTERIRKIERGKEETRPLRTIRPAARQEDALVKRPRKVFQAIVDHFDLARQAEDAGVSRKLKLAGFRGQAPLVTYLAVRLMFPFAIFLVLAVYIPLIVRPSIPFGAIMLLSAGFGSLGYFAPDVYLRNRMAKRQREIARTWPDGLDLILISVESGMSIEAAFRKVAAEVGPQSKALAEEMSITVAELAFLQDRRQAYDNLAERTGLESVRSVVTSLIQSEKHGTPVGQALRTLAKESRNARMNEAERKAAALPPKLTVPMIVFFLPVLFAVILTPAAIQMLDAY